jgi:hypothetical protein
VPLLDHVGGTGIGQKSILHVYQLIAPKLPTLATAVYRAEYGQGTVSSCFLVRLWHYHALILVHLRYPPRVR